MEHAHIFALLDQPWRLSVAHLNQVGIDTNQVAQVMDRHAALVLGLGSDMIHQINGMGGWGLGAHTPLRQKSRPLSKLESQENSNHRSGSL